MSGKPRYWVIVPAAGSGSRMQQDVPKQYLGLLGKTILEHTLAIFVDSLEAAQIVVCLAPSDEHFAKLEVSSRVETAVGGASRAESVLNGLCAIDAKGQDWVLVHDAARPCLSKHLLMRLVESLADDQVGGILAVHAKDTLKQAGEKQRIASTIDRAEVWQAQTPQMFRYGKLKDSLSRAMSANAEITDEASALEWAGYAPRLVEGDARNIKVTTPDDLLLAEFLLGAKGSTI